MRIQVVLADHNIQRFATTVDLLPSTFRVEARRGLADQGRKTTTIVRRTLKTQMNARRYGVVVQATSGFVQSDGLGFQITGFGKGLPIREFNVRVTGRGVSATPWNKHHLFKRSFRSRITGRLVARLGKDRLPIRSLYGPSVAKEIVKGETLAIWDDQLPHFEGAVIRRLRRLGWA